MYRCHPFAACDIGNSGTRGPVFGCGGDTMRLLLVSRMTRKSVMLHKLALYVAWLVKGTVCFVLEHKRGRGCVLACFSLSTAAVVYTLKSAIGCSLLRRFTLYRTSDFLGSPCMYIPQRKQRARIEREERCRDRPCGRRYVS